jgi:hypothetical protein
MKKNQQTFFLKSIFYQFCFIDVSNNNFHVWLKQLLVNTYQFR